MAGAALPSASAQTRRTRSGIARLIALLLPLSLLAGAYGSQYFGGLVPCEMCWWQRYAHFAALPFAVLAFTTTADSKADRIMTGLAALAIAASGAIGLYHAGVELHLLPGLTTCSAASSGLTGEDLLKSILNTPLVRCDEVQWSFLGVSMAGWNAIISLGGAAAIAFLLVRKKRG